MHYYPFNIGDYRKDTSRLNFLEHGIYRLLIDEYYLNESPLNPDLNFLYREFGIRTQEEKDCINYILGKFFVLDKNGYSHYGCEKVLKKIYDKSDKARKSVEARWNRKNTDVQKTDTDVQQSNTDVPKNDTTDILPITHNPLPTTHNPTHIIVQADKQLSQKSLSIDFELFWSMYPRKEGRQAAEKAWKKIKPNQELFDLMKIHLSTAYLFTEKQFIPHGSTYLNGKRWTDEITTKGKPTENLSTMAYGQSGDL